MAPSPMSHAPLSRRARRRLARPRAAGGIRHQRLGVRAGARLLLPSTPTGDSILVAPSRGLRVSPPDASDPPPAGSEFKMPQCAGAAPASARSPGGARRIGRHVARDVGAARQSDGLRGGRRRLRAGRRQHLRLAPARRAAVGARRRRAVADPGASRLPPLVGRSLLVWWPEDGWHRGTAARLCPRAAFSHAVVHPADVGAARHGGRAARRPLVLHPLGAPLPGPCGRACAGPPAPAAAGLAPQFGRRPVTAGADHWRPAGRPRVRGPSRTSELDESEEATDEQMSDAIRCSMPRRYPTLSPAAPRLLSRRPRWLSRRPRWPSPELKPGCVCRGAYPAAMDVVPPRRSDSTARVPSRPSRSRVSSAKHALRDRGL